MHQRLRPAVPSGPVCGGLIQTTAAKRWEQHFTAVAQPEIANKFWPPGL